MKVGFKKVIILLILIVGIYFLYKTFLGNKTLSITRSNLPAQKDLFKLIGRDINGFMDIKGNQIIKSSYYIQRDFKEGLAVVCKSDPLESHLPYQRNNCGYINKKGEIKIPLDFSFASDFSEGLAAVEFDDILLGRRSWGYINYDGKFVINPNFNSADDFHEGLAIVQFNNKDVVINTKGETLITQKSTFEYTTKLSGFSEGLAKVSRNKFPKHYGFVDINGYINSKGDMVIPLKYYNAEAFSEGLAKVSDGKKFGFINKKDKLVIPFQYDKVFSFANGLAVVYQSSKCGYINKMGKLVIPTIYDFCKSFSEGLAAVQIQSDWGYINESGKLVITPKFGIAFDFARGLAAVYPHSKELNIHQKYFNYTNSSSSLPDNNFPFNISYINRKGEYIFKDKSNE
ncbi:MAG: WG repeat-containing protein [Microcystis aeruginosa G11-01]|nr:WG repeat-containing protein [Microcystis aeruginosa G11-01]